MPYTATNDVDTMVLTQPLGTEPPNILDDAIREVKTVLANVTKKAHTSTGVHMKASMWSNTAGAAVPTPAGSSNTWIRRGPMNVTHDNGSIIIAGAFTNTWKLKAGVYFVEWMASGYRIGRFQTRLAIANSDTINPSDAAVVPFAYSNLAESDAANGPLISCHGSLMVTSNGTENYCLDFIYETNNTVNGWGRPTTLGGAWPNEVHDPLVKFTQLG